MSQPIVVYQSGEAMLLGAAEAVRARAARAVNRDGRFVLRIGTGALPARLLALLSAEPWRDAMPWPQTRLLVPGDRAPDADPNADLEIIGSGDLIDGARARPAGTEVTRPVIGLDLAAAATHLAPAGSELDGAARAAGVISLQLGAEAGRALGELRRHVDGSPGPLPMGAANLEIMTDAATAGAAREVLPDGDDPGPADDDRPKRNAGEAAARLVSDDEVIGLGTGSTAAWFVRSLGRRLRDGGVRGVVGVPTSEATLRLARSEGISTTSLSDRPGIDLTVDGADEVSPELDLIKGMGGALVREKIVARSSARMVVIADPNKLTPRLGTRHPVPLAVVPYGWESHVRALRHLPASIALRSVERDTPYVTDDGLYLLHLRFLDGIDDPKAIEATLESRPGAAACGLFLDLAERALVGDMAGVWDYRRTPRA